MEVDCLDAARWLGAAVLFAAGAASLAAEVGSRRWFRRDLDAGLADLDARLAEYRRRLGFPHARGD